MNFRQWILLVGITSALGCQGKPPPPFSLGHVGSGGRADQQASWGIRLALDEVNKDAAERKVVVRHTDAQGKLDAFEAEAVRLLAINQVHGLYGGQTPEEVARLDRAVKPEADDKPPVVPIVSPYGFRPRSMSKHVLLIGMSPQVQGKALARFAADKIGLARVSILVDSRNEARTIMAETFAREFADAVRKKQAKGEPIQMLSYGGDVKLTDLVARLDPGQPPAVLLAGSVEDLRLLKEAWEPMRTDLKKPAVILYAGDDGSLRPDEWRSFFPKEDGPPTTAIYLASAFAIDKDDAKITDFVERFHKQFQETPDVHAALAYEGTKLLAEGLRKASEPAKIRETVAGLKDFPGLAGPLSFDADGQVQRRLFILRLEREKLEVEERYAP